MKESLIRDRIVSGIRNDELTRRFLRQRNLSLEQCVDICLTEARTDQQVEHLRAEKNTELFAVSRTEGRIPRSPDEQVTDCQFCGRRHQKKKERCPAWGRTCMKCSNKGHFASCCRSYRVSSVADDAREREQELLISNMDGRAKSKCVFATLLVRGQPVLFQLDSGAAVNILPEKYCKGVRCEETQKCLKMWNRSRLQPKGIVILETVNPKEGTEHPLEFLIVSEDLMPILGIDSIQRFGFVSFNHERFIHACDIEADIFDKYSSVFDGGVGMFEGPAHLSLNELATPVALPARKVPIALREKFLSELQRLCSLGVIAKVDEPTDWVSQVAIITKKSGELRICIDPKPLNAALKREYFTLPTLDDMLPVLCNSKLFTKVDLASAFWHVSLDDESSYMTTFGTPFGRFRWLRLPFGLKVSSEIFQKRLMQALDDL
ncbi:unnamed protein product [Dicrocoelium dendriticum]|nr:unnamed protein product [Dicrocoelium dendriticum]